jgi:transposase-like protein
MGRFEEARQSVAEFCRGEGVSSAAFYQWRKRLAEARADGGRADGASGFRPVRVVTAVASVAVQLPGGTRFEAPTSDPQALRLVIDRLARADARRAGGGRC